MRIEPTKHNEVFTQKERSRKVFSGIVAAVLLSVIVFTFTFTVQKIVAQWKPAPEGVLTITQLDIGQGDALLIQTPGRKDILIDAGRDKQILTQLGQVLTPWNRNIEYIIATHDDADHIGGMPEVAQNFRVGEWIVNDHQKDTATSAAFRAATVTGQQPLHIAQAGERIDVEPDVWMDVLAPDAVHSHEDINDDSVVVIVHYKDFSLMLSGDASIIAEQEWLAECAPDCSRLNVDMLKLGHHGSRHSSSEEFLQATTPAVALISVGVDNDYGHPNAEIVQRLNNNDVVTYRTDEDGRVTCITNGSHKAECTTQFKRGNKPLPAAVQKSRSKKY